MTSCGETAHLSVFQVFLGGSIVSNGPVRVLDDPENQEQPCPRIVKVTNWVEVRQKTPFCLTSSSPHLSLPSLSLTCLSFRGGVSRAVPRCYS